MVIVEVSKGAADVLAPGTVQLSVVECLTLVVPNLQDEVEATYADENVWLTQKETPGPRPSSDRQSQPPISWLPGLVRVRNDSYLTAGDVVDDADAKGSDSPPPQHRGFIPVRNNRPGVRAVNDILNRGNDSICEFVGEAWRQMCGFIGQL